MKIHSINSILKFIHFTRVDNCLVNYNISTFSHPIFVYIPVVNLLLVVGQESCIFTSKCNLCAHCNKQSSFKVISVSWRCLHHGLTNICGSQLASWPINAIFSLSLWPSASLFAHNSKLSILSPRHNLIKISLKITKNCTKSAFYCTILGSLQA